MSTYPVHIYVDAAGRTYPASATDQYPKPVASDGSLRTVDGGRIPVAYAGLWWPSQMGYAPFREAVAAAQAEALNAGADRLAEIARRRRQFDMLLAAADAGRPRRRNPDVVRAARLAFSVPMPPGRAARRFRREKNDNFSSQVRRLLRTLAKEKERCLTSSQ